MHGEFGNEIEKKGPRRAILDKKMIYYSVSVQFHDVSMLINGFWTKPSKNKDLLKKNREKTIPFYMVRKYSFLNIFGGFRNQ